MHGIQGQSKTMARGFDLEKKKADVLRPRLDHALLVVDALFGNLDGDWCDQPNDSLSNMIIEGVRPLDGIEVVLVTLG
jgi:hypothetical protein